MATNVSFFKWISLNVQFRLHEWASICMTYFKETLIFWYSSRHFQWKYLERYNVFDCEAGNFTIRTEKCFICHRCYLELSIKYSMNYSIVFLTKNQFDQVETHAVSWWKKIFEIFKFHTSTAVPENQKKKNVKKDNRYIFDHFYF